MKYLVVAAVVAMVSLSVHAGGDHSSQRGGGGGGSHGRDPWDYSDIFDVSSSADDYQRAGYCACSTGGRRSRNTCYGIAGTAIIGCPNTNTFLQCVDLQCTKQTCPANQVWDRLKNACSECAAGKHPRTDSQLCVCDEGKTVNKTTGLCSACPTGATVEPDRCFCPANTTLDRAANECKACPTGSKISGSSSCKCAASTPKLYWNAGAWACQSCPGVVTSATRFRRFYTEEICNCTGANEVFDVKTVSCYTCPAAITTSKNGCCACKVVYAIFDKATETCTCPSKYVLNAAGTACVWNTATTGSTPTDPQATTSPNPRNP